MPESDDLGRRIREIRDWRKLGLRTTAQLAGLSHGYLGKLERGEKPINSRQVLEALALALRVSPDEFTGQLMSAGRTPQETHDAANVLANLLSGWWVGEVPDAPGRPLPAVLADLAAFHEARNNSAARGGAGGYPEQVDRLAPLVRDLLAAAADPATGHEALAPLLTAYHVAGSIAGRLRVPGMPSLAAERMRQVADKLDDPVWAGVADYARAQFISSTDRPRQYELSVKVADEAPPGRPETRGMANLTAALAEELGPDTSPWPAGIMQFGRTNAAIFRVSIDVELGHGTHVAEIAKTIRPETISTGRQATFWTDYGRGLLGSRSHREAGLAALLRAEALAPEQVRGNIFVREAVSSVLATARRDAGGRELRGLAWRMGVAPTG
ncbi:helix-turn-helix domain-containing protein [Amycolatopsis jiangsuensis]|uniref:Transcriptional regulator with XRE-family HTH domain n=1 Tax=Amycolatopsis jiangsuensis TaxID=1181879 RepID=A0A840IXC8_9PSEU|nr:helix-turn-helix transcriptional regulator [Amycolatopsis jiangsuensis]MBB4686149.1 transcriptional regulator with XRE-family HTH domain [Amycolatopsis jiangsuensis]